MTRIPSYKDYQDYTKVWIPKDDGNQRLFIVRVPTEMEQMEYQDYLDLMNCRVEWMIRDWLENYQQSEEETQALLAMTLQQMHPTQEIPDLYTGEREMKQIWIWASDWGDSLLECNEKWFEWMRLINPEVDFPVDLTQESQLPQAELMEKHNEVNLEEFLIDLRSDFD
ncbi:hypothetical protein ACSYAD_26820 [Acaryochloris marina NIES-2412]|uniref:hypothetical protein n=1 Tax=Acaryochloris marina TaxID=155978 RepID=UPI00405950E2